MNWCWFHQLITYRSNWFCGFHFSCLSVKCPGPFEDKQSRCCPLERWPQDWLSANYNLRFDYDLLSLFTCYLGHHAAKFARVRSGANCLVVNAGQFSVWCNVALVVESCGAINSRSDLIRGSVKADRWGLRPVKTVTFLVWSGWTISFLFLVWWCRWFSVLAGTWLP